MNNKITTNNKWKMPNHFENVHTPADGQTNTPASKSYHGMKTITTLQKYLFPYTHTS